MSIAMSYSAPAPSDYFTSGQHFLETFHFSPKQPETQTNGDFNVYFLKRQTWHTLLSQLSHISISSLYFFPFPRGLQHKRKLYIPCSQLKTIIKTFRLRTSLSLSIYIYIYLTTLSEETTQRKHTHARYNFSLRPKTTNFSSLKINTISFAKRQRNDTMSITIHVKMVISSSLLLELYFCPRPNISFTSFAFSKYKLY